MSLWIDFNDNNTFETSERLVNDFDYGTQGNQPYTGSPTVAIDINAALGSHMLRARSIYTQPSSDPCNNVQYGETEDYMVNIYDPAAIDENMNKNTRLFEILTRGNGKYTLNYSGFEGSTTMSVFNSLGDVVASKNLRSGKNLNQFSLSLTEFSHGSYLIRIDDESARRIKRVFR